MSYTAQEIKTLSEASINTPGAYLDLWIDKKCEEMGIPSREVWNVQFEQEYEVVFVSEEDFEPFEIEDFEDFLSYYD